MRNTDKVVVIFVIIFLCSTLSAQTSIDTTIFMKNRSVDESVKWYSLFENIPRQWHGWWDVSFTKKMTNEWMIIGGLTLATILTDDITYTPSARFYNSSPEAKKWIDFFAGFGDGRTQFALAGSFVAYGLALNDQKALRTGVQIASVVLSSGAIIQVLKHVTGRESPFVRTTPTGIWKVLPNQIDYHRQVPVLRCVSIRPHLHIAGNSYCDRGKLS